MRNRTHQKGFTMIEMMFVFAIITVLTMILFPAIEHAKDQAKYTACKENIRNIAVAYELYSIIDGKGRYSVNWDYEFGGLIEGGYLAKMPKCPNNPKEDPLRAYTFISQSFHDGPIQGTDYWYLVCGNHIRINKDEDEGKNEGYNMLVYHNGVGFIDIDMENPPWGNTSCGFVQPPGWKVGDSLPEGWEIHSDWTPAPGWTPPEGWQPGMPLPEGYPPPPDGWADATWGPAPPLVGVDGAPSYIDPMAWAPPEGWQPGDPLPTGYPPMPEGWTPPPLPGDPVPVVPPAEGQPWYPPPDWNPENPLPDGWPAMPEGWTPPPPQPPAEGDPWYPPNPDWQTGDPLPDGWPAAPEGWTPPPPPTPVP